MCYEYSYPSEIPEVEVHESLPRGDSWTWPRMTDCDMRLTSLGPIVEVLTRSSLNSEGWCLWIRHRHYAGTFSDCPASEYDRLTVEEYHDVVCASLFLQEGPGLV